MVTLHEFFKDLALFGVKPIELYAHAGCQSLVGDFGLNPDNFALSLKGLFAVGQSEGQINRAALSQGIISFNKDAAGAQVTAKIEKIVAITPVVHKKLDGDAVIHPMICSCVMLGAFDRLFRLFLLCDGGLFR